MDYKAPAAKVDRLERKAEKKQRKSDRLKAAGKSVRAVKAANKATKAGNKAKAKRDKQAGKMAKVKARQDNKDKRAAKRAERKAARPGKIKAAAKKIAGAGKKVAKAAGKAVKKAASKTPAAQAGKALANAAQKAVSMKHKGAAKFDRVVLGGNKDDKSKTRPGKRDYMKKKGTSMRHKGTAMHHKGGPKMSNQLKYDGSAIDQNKMSAQMREGGAGMYNHKSGGMYKGPSMGKIQYGVYEKPTVQKGTGGKGMSMMSANKITKHFTKTMKAPGKYHK